MIQITSIEFLLFVLRQDPTRPYDMRDELRESEVGSPLLHYCKARRIGATAVGAMDAYDNRGNVLACLERPTQAHFDCLNMEAGGTYGDLQVVIRDCHLNAISATFGEPINAPLPMGGKLKERTLRSSDDLEGISAFCPADRLYHTATLA